jgi:flagella basal body P-ring formation protein FlgA
MLIIMLLFTITPYETVHHSDVFGSDGLYTVSEATETRDRILELATAELYERFGSEQFRFTLSARWIPGTLLNHGASSILSASPGSTIDRHMNFEITHRTGNRTETTPVQLAVEVKQYIPVAARRIMSGETIAEYDVEKQWVSIVPGRDRLVGSAEELAGKTVRRTLVPGQPVRHADVSAGYLVEAGDLVTMIFEDGVIRVELTCEARQSGTQGEEIYLYSNETRKRYLGRVTGPGEVEWRRTY